MSHRFTGGRCTRSRRRAVRIATPPDLCVTFAIPGLRATAVDISFGGIGLVTNLPLKRNTPYDVRLQHGHRVVSSTVLPAHCRRRSDGQWSVGLTFVRDARLALIERLVDALTESLIEFS